MSAEGVGFAYDNGTGGLLNPSSPACNLGPLVLQTPNDNVKLMKGAELLPSLRQDSATSLGVQRAIKLLKIVSRDGDALAQDLLKHVKVSLPLVALLPFLSGVSVQHRQWVPALIALRQRITDYLESLSVPGAKDEQISQWYEGVAITLQALRTIADLPPQERQQAAPLLAEAMAELPRAEDLTHPLERIALAVARAMPQHFADGTLNELPTL